MSDLERLYEILRELESGVGGKRLMHDCNGHEAWPRRGVYFFFEPGEYRTTSAEQRVVRVGTHAVSRGSTATLWNRLRTHRGTHEGRGNHRGSIFRLHVGAALAARDAGLSVSSWGCGQTAEAVVRKKEEALERAVSSHIGKMRVLWLSVEDEPSASSDRAYLERNLVGLLAGPSGPPDSPSPDWLGRFSPDERIRTSGLWNLGFLDYRWRQEFLEVLNEYALVTVGKRGQPSKPIAPRDWYSHERQGIPREQMSLFGG